MCSRNETQLSHSFSLLRAPMNLGIRGSLNTCLHFHRARCPSRKSSSSGPAAFITAARPSPRLSLSPSRRLDYFYLSTNVCSADARTQTHAHTELRVHSRACSTWRAHGTHAQNEYEFLSRRGKLSNEFSLLLSPCVLLPGDPCASRASVKCAASLPEDISLRWTGGTVEPSRADTSVTLGGDRPS